ncbi:hypothetical protein VNO77_04414 [Canavalia gladiata]|uniref:Uncharacterized protein n=1 Tax=Canavalia gladiata TaxID=3824 RepID=A0AAN9N247_CANGL
MSLLMAYVHRVLKPDDLPFRIGVRPTKLWLWGGKEERERLLIPSVEGVVGIKDPIRQGLDQSALFFLRPLATLGRDLIKASLQSLENRGGKGKETVQNSRERLHQKFRK